MENDFPKRWVLIRGLTRGAFHWLNFADEFKKHFDLTEVFTPELAGNGALNEEISPSRIDQAVQQLRNQIPVEDQKTGLLSISMGGMIAARWAEMFPDEISHLVLINSSFASLSPFFQRLLPQNYSSLVDNFLFYDANKLEKFILRTTSNFEDKSVTHLEKLVQFQKNHPVSLSNFIRQLKISGTADCRAKPKAKTLILKSLKDRLVSHECSEAIAKKWNCAIETHPEAGHDLPLDDALWIFEKLQKNFGP